MIASEFDMFEHTFDVIVNEVRKYSANASKLEAKAEKQFKRLDVITIVQVKPKTHAVKQASRFNLQRCMPVKPSRKQRSSQARHVKPGRELLRCNQKLACFHRVLLCFAEKLPCFAANMSSVTCVVSVVMFFRD